MFNHPFASPRPALFSLGETLILIALAGVFTMLWHINAKIELCTLDFCGKSEQELNELYEQEQHRDDHMDRDIDGARVIQKEAIQWAF